MSNPPTSQASTSGQLRRIHASVALRLLEALRDRDLPAELLEDEDPSRTMPRRFGLSDVVDRQIRAFTEDARKGARLTDDEVRDLFRFVNRRPDGREVFQHVGRSLAGGNGSPGLTRILPAALRYAIARSRVRKRLKRLFGRPVGGFARGRFIIEGRSLLFIESDPGGDACHLLVGFCEGIFEQVSGETVSVRHSLCQARGEALCRWEVA
ncbi:MAG: 4-vinyl reductase [Gemmatimonadota bacterium]